MLAIVAHPDPRPKPRQARLAQQPAAEFALALGQHHVIAAPRQCQCRFKPGRPCPNDQNLFGRMPRGDDLGMPALAPLLAHGRVLGAAQMHRLVVRRAADVAADALADLILASLGNLGWQERIGNRRPRRANEILNAALDLAHHRIGRGEAPDAHHGLRCEPFDESDMGLLKALRAESRALGIIAEAARDVDIPEIGKLRQHRHHVTPLAAGRDATGSMQLIDRQPDRHGTGITDCLLGIFQHLADEAHPVGEAATIFVDARVAARRQELKRQIIMPGINIDNVEARAFRPQSRVTLPGAEGTYVGLVHGPRRSWRIILPGAGRWRQQGLARHAVATVRTAMPQLDSGQAAMRMNGLGNHRHAAYIFFVPQAEEAIG